MPEQPKIEIDWLPGCSTEIAAMNALGEIMDSHAPKDVNKKARIADWFHDKYGSRVKEVS